MEQQEEIESTPDDEEQTIAITVFDDCDCDPPLIDTFLEQYLLQIQTSTVGSLISNVMGMTRVELLPGLGGEEEEEECDNLMRDTTFDTSVLASIRIDASENANSEDSVNPPQDEAILTLTLNNWLLVNLFVESYHACNLLRGDLCDPN